MLKASCFIALLSIFSFARSIQIGKIENYIMIGVTNYSLMNITRDECICQMVMSNQSIVASNYFQVNQTCQLFDSNTSSVTLQLYFNSSFIFLNESELSIAASQSNVASTPSLINAFWSFDGNTNDQNSKYASVSINNVSYFSPGITGYGSALCFNASLSQYVLINSTVNINLSFRSFTFELWIYPFSLTSDDRGMIAQCQSFNPNQCLHLTVRAGKLRMSFYGNACYGTTPLTINTWYHLAFVYDNSTSTQQTYINGVSECNHTSSQPLQVTNLTFVPITVGYTTPYSSYYFDGLIDQLSLVGWAKNTSEILNDATLVVWYSFDNQSSSDAGPNAIPGVGVQTSFKNNSILFNNTTSYFQSSGFVLLGIDNRSYSFAIWINPLQTNQTTVLHGYQNTSAADKWCLSFLNFDSQGRIQAQSRSIGGLINVIGPAIPTNVWTHLVQTYSPINGISLYVNGSLFNQSSSCDYRSAQIPIILRLGSVLDDVNGTCFNTSVAGRQYNGWMDEFRVYSRELTSNDVQTLAIR